MAIEMAHLSADGLEFLTAATKAQCKVAWKAGTTVGAKDGH